MKTVGKVTCKACGRVFESGDAWKKNTTCDQPSSCMCPEVQLSMRRAAQAIDKAKGSAGYIVRKKEECISTNRAEDEHYQLWVTVAPLLTMEIIKPKKVNRGKHV